VANERQRAVGSLLAERYPKGDAAQQHFRMLMNARLQSGVSGEEAESAAVAQVRETRPGFVPLRATN
jgi:hypothetical protein